MQTSSIPGLQNRQPRLSTSSQPVLSHQSSSRPIQSHPPSEIDRDSHTLTGSGEGVRHYNHQQQSQQQYQSTQRYSVGNTSSNGGQVYQVQASTSRVNIGWKDTSVNEANAMTQARGSAANLKPISRGIGAPSGNVPSGSRSSVAPSIGERSRKGRESESDSGEVAESRGKVTEHTGGDGGLSMGRGNKKVSPQKKGKGRAASVVSPESGEDEGEGGIVGGKQDLDRESHASRSGSEAPEPRARGRTPIQRMIAVAERNATYYLQSRQTQDPSRSASNMGADESFQEEPSAGGSRFGMEAEVSLGGGSRVGGGHRDFDESSVFSREDSSYQYETNFVEAEKKRRAEARYGREPSITASLVTGRGGSSQPNKRSPVKHGRILSTSTSGRKPSGKVSGKDRGYRPGDLVPGIPEDGESSSADDDAGEGIAANKERRDNAGRRIPPKGPGYLGDELSFNPSLRASRRRSGGGNRVDEHGDAMDFREAGGNGFDGERINYDERSEEERDDGSDHNPSEWERSGGKARKVMGSPPKKAASRQASKPKTSADAQPVGRFPGVKAGHKQNHGDGEGILTTDHHRDEDDYQRADLDSSSSPARLLTLVKLLLSTPLLLVWSLLRDFVLQPGQYIWSTLQRFGLPTLNGKGLGRAALALLALCVSLSWFRYIQSNVPSDAQSVAPGITGHYNQVRNRGYSKPHIPSEGGTGVDGGSSETLDRLAERLEYMERALQAVTGEQQSLRSSQKGFEVRQNAYQASEAEAARTADEQQQRELNTLKHDASDLRAQIGELSKSVQRIGADSSRYRSDVDHRLDTHSKQIHQELGDVRAKVAQLETQVRESLTEAKWVEVLERVLPNVVPVRTHRDTGQVEIDPKLWMEMKRVLTTKSDVETIIRKAINAATIPSGTPDVMISKPSWRDFLDENEDDLGVWADQMFERKARGAMLLGRDHFLEILRKELDSLRAEVQSKADDQETKLQAAIEAKTSARSNNQRKPSVRSETKVVFSSDDGNNMTGVFEDLIDAAILRYSKDTIARADYALTTAGGRVIKSQTTPSIVLEAVPRWKHTLFGTKSIFGRDASLALHPEIAPGMCWAFKGNKGQLGVMLSRMVVVTDVTVEHAPAELISAASLQTAPKAIQVWATLEDMEDLRQYRDYLMENEHAREMAKQHDSDRPTAHHVLLTTLTYDPYLNHAPSHVQTFPVNQDLVAMGLKTQSVVFKITDNWGGSVDDFTCLYRVRVHGDAVEDSE